jgi:hypothetical protein
MLAGAGYPSPGDVHRVVTAPTRGMWDAMRLDRRGEDVALSADFEYENADRWAITPGTLEQVLDQLRPSNR